jgi:hypothetical protein
MVKTIFLSNGNQNFPEFNRLISMKSSTIYCFQPQHTNFRKFRKDSRIFLRFDFSYISVSPAFVSKCNEKGLLMNVESPQMWVSSLEEEYIDRLCKI